MDTMQKSLVVMVMQEHGGIAERLGLIIFNKYVDTVDDVRIHFDLDRIRKRPPNNAAYMMQKLHIQHMITLSRNSVR